MNIMINLYNTNSKNPYFGAATKYPLMPKSQLIQFLKEGMTYKQISEALNIPIHVINRAMKVYNIKNPRYI